MNNTTVYKMFADGGSRGNPGPAASGAVLYLNDQEISGQSWYLGVTTNNVAEYTGLIRGLELALSHAVNNLQVYMDSELVIKQMRGEYRVKHPNLQPLHATASTLARKFHQITFSHVPRAQNARADELANYALDQAAAGGYSN